MVNCRYSFQLRKLVQRSSNRLWSGWQTLFFFFSHWALEAGRRKMNTCQDGEVERKSLEEESPGVLEVRQGHAYLDFAMQSSHQ
jgi:hypothetical protein